MESGWKQWHEGTPQQAAKVQLFLDKNLRQRDSEFNIPNQTIADI